MLTSQSIPTRSKPVKSLDTSLQREEAKTPECEKVCRTEPVKATQILNKSEEIDATEFKSEEKIILSIRASRVKEHLNKTQVISAVLLTPDGGSDEIKCDTSSTHINAILHGRPTVVGELEEIGAIIVRCLQCDDKQLNKNILPPPFCNQQYAGNYLLFKVDETGNPCNLSLKQYEKFVGTKKTEIHEIRKNYIPSADILDRGIKVKSTFDSDSKLRLVYLGSEIDEKVRSEFKSENGRNPTESELPEICLNVNNALQDLVDELVGLSSNRMIDPDYDIESDVYVDPDYNPTEEEENDFMAEKQRDWRNELKDALKCARLQGNADSGVLAERISNIYYEINGVEPTLNELMQMFIETKSKFINTNNSNKAESVEATKYELQELVTKLVNKALADNDILNLKMLKTPTIKSRTGISESYNVYFCEFDEQRKEKNILNAIKSFKMRNRRKPTKFEIGGIKHFLARKKETRLVQFKLSVVGADEDIKEEEEKKEYEPTRSSSKLFISAIQRKKNSTKYSIYFDEHKSEKYALQQFEKFNKRKATKDELHLMQKFIKSDDEKLQEIHVAINAPINAYYIEQERAKDVEIEKPMNYFTDYKVQKKDSTKYVLQFNGKTARENGDKQQAIKWFERFNNRAPTDTEKRNINEFIQNDIQNDTIDID